MAEQNVTATDETTEVDETATDETTEEVDWEAKYKEAVAQSRKWEERSKQNKAKADKWDAYEQEGLSEAEKAQKRAEKAEAELADMKAKAERAVTVAKVADDAGIPAEVVQMLNGADETELAEQVGRILKLLPAYPTRQDDGGSNAVAKRKKTTADQFADSIKFF